MNVSTDCCVFHRTYLKILSFPTDYLDPTAGLKSPYNLRIGPGCAPDIRKTDNLECSEG